MGRTLVMGDIHGACRAMEQCLNRSGFDQERDLLIQLGDVVDGYPESFECVEQLLKIKKRICIKGNHDDWFNDFLRTGVHPSGWSHGGKGTMVSYLEHAGKQGRYIDTESGLTSALLPTDVPKAHQLFFGSQQLYHIDHHQRGFVHAGFDRKLPFLDQDPANYYWDRSLWQEALDRSEAPLHTGLLEMVTTFHEIYIGHTPTTKNGTDQPLSAFNIMNLDTGAGHAGRLTIMDIDTREVWQSDPLPTLYTQNFRV